MGDIKLDPLRVVSSQRRFAGWTTGKPEGGRIRVQILGQYPTQRAATKDEMIAVALEMESPHTLLFVWRQPRTKPIQFTP